MKNIIKLIIGISITIITLIIGVILVDKVIGLDPSWYFKVGWFIGFINGNWYLPIIKTITEIDKKENIDG